jgi:hypothetical protein
MLLMFMSLRLPTEFFVSLVFSDSRSAGIVIRTLRRIADRGRAVCATIHQPSSQIFHMFVSSVLQILINYEPAPYCGPTS